MEVEYYFNDCWLEFCVEDTEFLCYKFNLNIKVLEQ